MSSKPVPIVPAISSDNSRNLPGQTLNETSRRAQKSALRAVCSEEWLVTSVEWLVAGDFVFLKREKNGSTSSRMVWAPMVLRDSFDFNNAFKHLTERFKFNH